MRSIFTRLGKVKWIRLTNQKPESELARGYYNLEDVEPAVFLKRVSCADKNGTCSTTKLDQATWDMSTKGGSLWRNRCSALKGYNEII